MKTTAFGVAAMGIVMFVFIALLQLVTFDTRAVSLQDTLQGAMENSLSTALDQRAYAVDDQDELVADVVQGVVLELNDPRAELDVTVNAADRTLGLLSMTLTAHYPSVNTGEARDGTTVSVDGTVILEHVNNEAAAGTQVVVFESGAGHVVKRYSLTAGSQQLPYPTYEPGGGRTFFGWVLGETKYPNNVEGRAALQGLPLNQDYTFVAEESAPLGAPSLEGTRPSGKSYANYSWTSNAEPYVGVDGTRISYDIQQRDDDGSWDNVALDSSMISLNSVDPRKKSNGYYETITSLRVRVKNDAGFSPWATKTVTVGELPTVPSVSVTSLSQASGGETSAKFTWTAGSYARDGWRYQISKNGGSYGYEGTVSANSSRYRTVTGGSGESHRIRVRGENQFGVSGWDYQTVNHDGAPTAKPSLNFSPRTGYMYGSWSGVSRATSYETKWYVNTTDPSTARYYTWTNSATRSANWTGGINEGDKVSAVIRGCNEWGCGPWSSWTGWVYTDIRNVPSPSIARSDPHLSGGYYSWYSTSCDTGSRAEYRVYNAGSWTGWSTSRSYVEPFSYGSSGAISVRQRCINTTTGQYDESVSALPRAGWRLLPLVSSYSDYSTSSWGNSEWLRLEQILDGYDPGGIAINGSTFGRSPNYEVRADYWYETRVLQRWLNSRDGGQSANVTDDGYWGPDTTNKIRAVLNYRCAISVSTTTWSENAFDAYEMHRLTWCMNAGGY